MANGSIRLLLALGPALGLSIAGLTIAGLTIAGCATGGGELDGGRRDSGPRGDAMPDVGVADAGPPRDAGDSGPRDAGPLPDARPVDSGPLPDSGPPPDSGPRDSGIDTGIDSGRDAGMTCPPTPERIAIVEVMIAARTGAGDLGEWIEIVNVGDCTVDLTGVTLLSGTAMFTIPDLTIPAGAQRVLAQSADPVANYGVPFDISYAGSGIVLDNASDSVELRTGSTVYDRVTWTSTDHVAGTARMFPTDRAISMNDSQIRWCNATATYGMAGASPLRGTPGAANGTCP